MNVIEVRSRKLLAVTIHKVHLLYEKQEDEEEKFCKVMLEFPTDYLKRVENMILLLYNDNVTVYVSK
jgi:hypothetical protein